MTVRYPVVVVDWNDATQQHAETTQDELATKEDLLMTTAGLLIRDEPWGITVARDWSPDRPDDVFRCSITILRTDIVKVTDTGFDAVGE